MGYETRMYVVAPWSSGSKTSEELAQIDLSNCSCGGGAVINLINKYTKIAKEEGQTEAVELLRKVANLSFSYSGFEQEIANKKTILKLADDIEDGHIIRDCYHEPLPKIPAKEFLDALEEDYKQEKYRRLKWAIDLLKSIMETFTERALFVVTYGH